MTGRAGFAFADIAPSVWDAVVPEPRQKPMQTWRWAACALDAYSDRDTARICLIGDPDAPKALLPLMQRGGAAGWLGLVGNEGGGVDMPRRDDSSVGDIARALVAQRRPIVLGDLPAASPLIPALKTAAKGRAMVVTQPLETPITPWRDLDDSWRTPEAHLKKKVAQSLRRRERRLREEGTLTFDVLTPGPDTAPDLLEEALDLEARGWKARAGIALASQPAQAAFFTCYLTALAQERRLHVTCLRLDGKLVAMSLGEVFAGTYWAHKTAYDEAFRKFGPGILMQYHLIRHLAETGVKRIDFQGVMDAFKMTWAEDAVDAVKVRLYPFNPRGALAVAQDGVAQIRRRAAKSDA